MIVLNEAEATKKIEFRLGEEKKLKDALIANLRDDGKGHHHAWFAKHLENFELIIVPLDSRICETACISWEDGTIYINEGFLNPVIPNIMEQLNVLMRHELAHNLMMHQIRMMNYIAKKYSVEYWQHMSMSSALREMANIVEDAEISNERYTPDDKLTVKYMNLNGQVVGGIVTDSMRSGWSKLSVTEMWDKIAEEEAELNNNITKTFQNISNWDSSATIDKAIDIITGYNKNDLPARSALSHYNYKNITSRSYFAHPLEKIIKSNAFNGIFKFGQEIVKAIYNEVEAGPVGYTKDQIMAMLKEIQKTSQTEVIDLTSPATGEIIVTLYTPEEKYIAVETLKNIIDFYGDYDGWKAKTIEVLANYSAQDLQKIIDKLK